MPDAKRDAGEGTRGRLGCGDARDVGRGGRERRKAGMPQTRSGTRWTRRTPAQESWLLSMRRKQGGAALLKAKALETGCFVGSKGMLLEADALGIGSDGMLLETNALGTGYS